MFQHQNADTFQVDCNNTEEVQVGKARMHTVEDALIVLNCCQINIVRRR